MKIGDGEREGTGLGTAARRFSGHSARSASLQIKHLCAALQSHGPWKDFKFWSFRHSGFLLP